METSLGKIDRLVAEEKFSDAIMLGFQLLQNGIDYELIEDELCFSLSSFTSNLVSMGRQENAEWLWKKGMDLCHWNSLVLLHGYAKFKCSINEVLQGADLLSAAAAKPHSCFPLPLAESLENMKALVADQWHYRMLNDKERNEAYDGAIKRALQIRPGATVLDIGGGTGLLSIFAARAGADHVYCCEMSKAMADIAQKCIEMNGYSDKVTVIQKHSTDLVVGVDLPSRVDIVVTELVDSGLLGEHIISTLRHAKKHLLVSDTSSDLSNQTGVIIPYSAKIFGVAIDSDAIAARQRLLSPAFVNSNDYTDRSESILNDSSWSEIQYELFVKTDVQISIDENYTCEAINGGLPHTELTKHFIIGEVFFDDSQCHNYDQFISIPAISSGKMEAIAYWFDMQLLAPEHHHAHENTSDTFHVSTNPLRENNSWDQALVFTSKGEAGPSLIRHVDQGSVLNLFCEITDDMVCLKPDTASSSKNVTKTLVGEMDIAALNDVTLTECYMDALNRFVLEYKHIRSTVRILEMTNLWKSNALTYKYAQGHSKCEQSHPNVSSTIICVSQAHADFLSHLAKQLSSDHSLEGDMRFVKGSIVELYPAECQLSQYVQIDNRYDLIICDLIEGSGMMKQGVLDEISFALRFLLDHHESSLHVSRRLMPFSLGVMLCLLESDVIYSQFRIDPSRTVQVDVGSVLDNYKVTVLRELNLKSALPFPPSNTGEIDDGSCSPKNATTGRFLCDEKEVVELQLFDILHTKCDETVEVDDDSLIMSEVFQLTAVCDGIVHCVTLWYYIYMTSDCKQGHRRSIYTGPNEEDPLSHWRQVGFLLDTPLPVHRGETVLIRVIIDRVIGIWCQVIP